MRWHILGYCVVLARVTATNPRGTETHSGSIIWKIGVRCVSGTCEASEGEARTKGVGGE